MRVLLVLLASCRALPVHFDEVKPAFSDFACAEGELRLASTGSTYATFSDALADAAIEDYVCAGAGTFALGESTACTGVHMDEGRRLSIVGAGSDRTVLVGSASSRADSCRDLAPAYYGEGSAVTLAGITLSDALVLIEARSVELVDVVSRDVARSGVLALHVEASKYTAKDVAVVDNRLDYLGFSFGGEGVLTDFVVARNTYGEGYLGYFRGAVSWEGGEVVDNARTLDMEPGGYDLLEHNGALTLRAVTFSGNRTNGPLLSGFGDLMAERVIFADNDATGSAVLRHHSYEDTTTAVSINESVFVRNVSPDAAVGLYDGATLTLDDVDFGTGVDANGTCDVSVDGACAAEGLGPHADLACDGDGCE